MKNTKWVWRILAVVLSLAVLAGVGFAGFRIGVVQGANLTSDEFSSMFAGRHGMAMDNGNGDMPHGQGFDHGRNFGGHDGFGGPGSFRGGRGNFGPLGFVFGLFRLAVLGGLIWLGYTLVKRSGWRVVNVNANQAAAPAPVVVDETPSAEGEEKKDEA